MITKYEVVAFCQISAYEFIRIDFFFPSSIPSILIRQSVLVSAAFTVDFIVSSQMANRGNFAWVTDFFLSITCPFSTGFAFCTLVFHWSMSKLAFFSIHLIFMMLSLYFSLNNLIFTFLV